MSQRPASHALLWVARILPWAACAFVFFSLLIVPFRQPFFVMGLEGDAQLHLEFLRYSNNPTLYARDVWLIPGRVLSRGPTELLWYRAAATVSRALPVADPEAFMSYAFSVLCFLLFIAGTWRLTVRFRLPPWMQAIVLLMVMIPTALVEGPWNTAPTGMNLSRNSYSLYPWLLLLLVSARPEWVKGVLLGLAGWVYPFLTLHIGFVELLRRLPSLRTKQGWCRALSFGVGVLVPFSAVLWMTLTLKDTNTLHGVSSRLALVWEAQPSYLNGAAFLLAWRDHAWLWFLCASAVLLGVYLLREYRSFSPTVRAFFPYFFLPIPFGLASWFLLPVLPDLFFLQIWRLPIMSSMLLLPLFGVVLLHAVRAKHLTWVVAFLVLFLVFLRVDAFRYRALVQQAWFPTHDASPFQLAETLRQETPPETLLLTPPDVGTVMRVQGQRAVVFDGTELFIPWFTEEWGRTWLALRKEVVAAYATGPDAVCQLAHTYEAEVTVFPAGMPDLPVEPFACDSGYCAIRCPAPTQPSSL